VAPKRTNGSRPPVVVCDTWASGWCRHHEVDGQQPSDVRRHDSGMSGFVDSAARVVAMRGTSRCSSRLSATPTVPPALQVLPMRRHLVLRRTTPPVASTHRPDVAHRTVRPLPFHEHRATASSQKYLACRAVRCAALHHPPSKIGAQAYACSESTCSSTSLSAEKIGSFRSSCTVGVFGSL
jgi:hypothetical protein